MPFTADRRESPEENTTFFRISKLSLDCRDKSMAYCSYIAVRRRGFVHVKWVGPGLGRIRFLVSGKSLYSSDLGCSTRLGIEKIDGANSQKRDPGLPSVSAPRS